MRKRSKYRPKPVIQNTMEFVLSGMRPVRDLPGVYLAVNFINSSEL